MVLSMSIVVSLLALSVSALTTPHHGLNARDRSLAGRHHNVARQANNHSIVRRSARRKRCLEKTALAFSSSSAADTSTSSSGNSVLSVPVNVDVAPGHVTPTTTPEAAQPTTYYAPQPTTTTTPTPTPTPNEVETQASGSGQTFSGDGTFFDVGLGACGKTSVNTDYIVAIGWQLFDSFAINGDPNPNRNPVCDKRIRATFEGKSVTVVVLDRCGGCQPHDLDFSPSAFNQLANPSLGRLKNVQWQFV